MNEQTVPGAHLSPLQKRIWLLQMESPVYFLQATVGITGKLDKARLAESISLVIHQHEILRTSYTRSANLFYPMQVVSEASSCILQEMSAIAATNPFIGIKDFNYQNDRPLCARLFSRNDDSHELVISLPAMAADIYSVQRIAKEIAETYSQPGNKEDDGFKNAIQYGQFAEWQQELISSPDEFAVDFWQKYPYEKGNDYALPFTHYETTGGAFQPAIIDIALDTDIVNKLTALENNGSPVSMVLMACFYLSLHRLTGLEETTIGYTAPGRDYEELENTMGLLSRTLPVVISSRVDDSLLSLAKRLEGQIKNIREYGEYFSWTDEQPNMPMPYFRSIFEYAESNANILLSNDSQFRLDNITSMTDKFDIKLNVQRREKALRLQLCYDSSSLNKLSATAMAAQLTDILIEAIDAPGENVNAIAARSIKPVVFEGDSNKGEPVGKNIIELFEDRVKHCGDCIAVQDGDHRLTYSALNQKAEELAAYLTSQWRIKPGDIVALCMQRSKDMIVTMIGILKTGAAYLPIDSKTPPSRIQYMMEDSQAALLITDDTTSSDNSIVSTISVNTAFWNNLPVAGTIRAFSCKKCRADCKKGAARQSSCREDHIDISPSAIAYIIYTSGSTGKPKAVLISHGSLVNYAHWFISKYGITESDRSLLFSSIAFDLCYTSLWSSLLSGAALYIHKEAEYLDPVEFIKDMVDNRITYIKLTPSHFNLIARDPAFAVNSKKYDLRLVVVGGEEIIAEDIEKYLQQNPSVKFVNHYGPTETTIGVLTKDIDKNNIRQFRQKTVLGRANANNQVIVFDNDARRLCAVGETGEIAVSGKGLAAGYLNRIELTEEKFVPHPFLKNNLLYRTGDLGRWMPDGNIEFLGRKDFQVKIRGYRIETGEIEEALLDYPEVEDASVQLMEHPETKDKKLVAFLKTGERINNTALNDNLQSRLPHYMVPAEFIGMPSFPLLPNGKLDRKALQELAGQQQTGAGYIAPRTNTERLLTDIWQEVLNGRKCGIRDNFFHLGGHSLKAAQLVSRIYKTFNKKIELRAIFDYPTIEQLARVLNTTGDGKAYESIRPVSKMEYYEVSHAQRRLWILNHFKKDELSYNSSCYYRIKGPLEITVLKNAFKALIERHESLRTTFVSIDGTPWQKINSYDECGFKLETADVRTSDEPSATADKLALSGYYSTFDLENGPLLRAMVIRVEEDAWLFACNIHHIVYDGWSLNILFNELLTIYNAFTDHQENPLPPLAIQYKDYSAWHNAMISEGEESYWLKKLANYPKLISLPYDKIDFPDELPYARQNICLNEEDSRALKEIAKAANTTLSNLFLSIYGLFINQVSGQGDIMIGIGHANRNHEDTEKLIGFFINMLVIRMRFSEEDTLDELVKQVSENSIEAFQHSNYPFDLLVEKLCVNRYADRQPILNVMYDFKNFHDILLQEDLSPLETSLRIEQVRIGETMAAHDLILHVADNEKTILYDFEYKKECFLPGTIRNFYSIFNNLVNLFIRELSPAAMAAY